MKRFYFIYLLFVILLLGYCIPQEPKINPPKAVKGVLDLSSFHPEGAKTLSHLQDETTSWDFATDGAINLDGEWEFYFGELIEPIASVGDAYMRHLQTNNNPANQNSPLPIPNYIPVPSQWQNHGYPVDGYATYRLRVILPKSVPAKSVRVGDAYMHHLHEDGLSIAMSNAGTSYEMYINGKLASVNGKVGKSKEETVPFRQHRNFPIDRFLYDFDSDKNEFEVVVHVSNFHHRMSGLWLPFKLDTTLEIEKRAKQKIILDLFVIASLLIIGFYHLGLYWNRKKDKTALYFGIFCLLFGIRSSSLDEAIIFEIVPQLPFLVMHKFEYFAFFYGGIVFAQYIHSLFSTEFEKKWIRGLRFILLPLSGIVILFPLKIYTYTLLPGQITVLLSILYIFKVQIFAAFHRLAGAKLVLFSWVIFAFTVVNDILNGMSLIATPLLVQYGFVAFIFMQSITLSKRFAGGFEQAEKLSDDLQVLTQSLESKISDGVREKEKYNQCLLELNKSKTKELSGLESALQEVTETCSKILNVDRVSIWILDQKKNELKSVDLFNGKENNHEKGRRFVGSNFPKYFQYLKEEDLLSATNVYTHPGIMEFNEEYHTILKIQSALDSPIRSGGNIIGVISCEKLEIEKEWTADEENFVSSLASILASHFESEERRQAYIELTETKKEIEEINTFSHLVNSLPDLNSIFTEISKYFNHKFGITGSWLFLPDEKREYLYAFKAYSYLKLSADKYNYLMNKNIPLKENEGGTLYRTFQRKKPFYLSKISKFEFEIDKEFVETLSVISFLYVPLIRKDECVGIFAFSNLEKEMILSKSDIHKISNLCSQIAGSIDTNHLLKQVDHAKNQADTARIEAEIERGISVIAKIEVEKAKQKTENLNQLIKKVNETSDLEKIMSIILTYVKDNYNLPYYTLLTLSTEEELLKFANAVLPDYISVEHRKIIRSSVVSVTSQNMNSIHSRSLALKTPIFIPDAEVEIQTESGKALQKILKHKSSLTIPIILQNNPIGTLDFFSLESVHLREEEITELSLLTEQLAGIIQGSILFTQVQKEKEKAVVAKLEAETAKEEVEKLNEFSKLINSTSDISLIFKEIYSYLSGTFGFTDLWVLLVDKNKKELYSDVNTTITKKVDSIDFVFFKNFQVKLDEKLGTLYQTYTTATPLYVPDVSIGDIKTKTFINHFNGETYSYSKADFKIMIKGKLKSLLQIPLILQNEVIGIVCLSIFDKLIELSQDRIEKLVRFSNQIAGVIHNAQLLRQTEEAKGIANVEKEKALVAQKETEKQKKETEELNLLIKSLNEELDLKVIMQKVHKYVNEKFKIHHYALYSMNHDKTVIQLMDANFPEFLSEDDKKTILEFKIPIQNEKGAHSFVIKTSKYFYIPKVQIPRVLNAASKEELFVIQKYNSQSMLLIPLRLNNEFVGILDFQNYADPMNLSKNDITRLSILGEQLTGIIHGSNLFKQVQEEKEKALVARNEAEKAKDQVEFLNKFSKVINSSNNLDIIFSHAVENLSEKINTDIFILQLIDKTKNELFTRCMSGTDSDLVRKYNKIRVSLIPESGRTYLTYNNKKTFYLKNTKRISEDKKSELDSMIEKDFQIDSAFLIPLLVDEEVIGIMSINKSGGMKKLSKDEIRFVESLCEQLALAVNNSFLLEETEQARQETEGLNLLMKNVNSTADIFSIMIYIIQYLENNFGFTDYYLLSNEETQQEFVPVTFTSPANNTKIWDYFMGVKIPQRDLTGALAEFAQQKKVLYLEKENFSKEDSILKAWAEKANFDYALLLPFVVYEELIGFLYVHVPKSEVNIDKEILLKLERFSDSVAGTIFNSRLFKRVEEAKEIAEKEREIAKFEQNKSEKLLLNILPKDVAKELKEKGFAEPVLFENVSVMFTDFKGFTIIAETLSPQELIKDLDACFVQFDKISERFNLEKLKTIGDSYMCAGGIPKRNKTHAIDCCLAALEIQSFMNLMKKIKEEQGYPYWELRLGIHTGPLIAGVIGERKFAYDVWGDTVNTASRMESSGTPGKINISYSTYEAVKDYFDCEYRGEVAAKNKGLVKMYYLYRIKPELSKDELGLMPNGKFWKIYG